MHAAVGPLILTPVNDGFNDVRHLLTLYKWKLRNPTLHSVSALRLLRSMVRSCTPADVNSSQQSVCTRS